MSEQNQTSGQNFMLFSKAADSNNLENQIDKKLQLRQNQFSSESNYGQIKESAISSELSLGNDERAKLFKNRRLKARLNIGASFSLKDKIKIPEAVYHESQNMRVGPEDLKKCFELFSSDDVSLKYKGLVGLRMLLSLPTNPPIQEMIDFGLVSGFISLLDSNYPEFQYEALWCLTNIATGTTDQANAIVVKGGLDKIIGFLDSSIEELQNQAAWTIGNLAGDSQRVRDQIIAQKGFDKMITIFSTTERPMLLRHCVWALSNFCRVKPPMPYELLKKVIPCTVKGINYLKDDDDFLVDACWLLSYLTEKFKKSIKEIMDTGVLPLLFSLLDIDSKMIQLSCLRIVGNIASGNANQTQELLDQGVLPYLKKTIYNPNKSIRKETAWIISNIAAGTQRQIEMLITEDFLPLLIDVIQKDQPDIQKEAIWAVCNLTSIEKTELMEKIIKQQIIEIICECLKSEDAKYLAVSLEAFGNLLMFGKKFYSKDGVNLIVKRVEELGMFEVLEKLQYHPVEIVYEKTIKLLETYFDTENSQ